MRPASSFASRLKRVKPRRWVLFGIFSLLFFGFMFWSGAFWLLPVWLLLADMYITHFIPWDWWKYSKSVAVYIVMRVVTVVFYILTFLYFLFNFVGQNYQIPSSSLEKTLLTGDNVWVNKMVYGPRVPQTPLHLPLAQNQLYGLKSYLEHPQLKYHRLKGLRNVERGDIVVFNYPCGDTVVRRAPQGEDYYMLCQRLGRAKVLSQYEVMWRPVDRRDAYIKRCIGLPGERISSRDGVVYIDGKAIAQSKNVQFMYTVDTGGRTITDNDFDELGISVEDRRREMVNGRALYYLPLTDEMANTLRERYGRNKVRRVTPSPDDRIVTFPAGYDYGWNHRTFGEIWIPKKGEKIELNQKTYRLYERCIRTYEGNTLECRGSRFYINGERATSYTFQMDYYWMMGDNRDNSIDSRYWGFVPEDHIIGTTSTVIFSVDKDKGVRWHRILTNATTEE